mgnify:CR=1 FL=1
MQGETGVASFDGRGSASISAQNGGKSRLGVGLRDVGSCAVVSVPGGDKPVRDRGALFGCFCAKRVIRRGSPWGFAGALLFRGCVFPAFLWCVGVAGVM